MQENEVVGEEIGRWASIKHSHRYVVKQGKMTGRQIILCSLCSHVTTWGPIPHGATRI
jgi:hypothetical protein